MAISGMNSYAAVGNREDLYDVITMISPTDTYLLSNLKRVKATNRTHEWLTDTLAAAAANAQVEGEAYTFAIRAPRARLSNSTQIFWTPVEVTDTQREIDAAGVQDEFAYQLEKAMKEQARDMENAFVTGTGNSGASGTARELKGILAFVATNVETGTGTGTETLTETMYNNLLQTVYAQGGNPNVTLANSWQKRQITTFATSDARYQKPEAGKVSNMIAIYESNFGVQKIVLHRWMDTDKVAVLEQEKFQIATLRPTKTVDVAKVGSASRAVVESELTLVSLNEKASGKITQLATS